MTRLLFAVGSVAAAAAGALLALAARDLRRSWSWPVDEMDTVQPQDSWPPPRAEVVDLEPSYLEAQALAYGRYTDKMFGKPRGAEPLFTRSSQTAAATTGGM